MASILSNAAARIRKTGAVVPIFIAFVVLAVIGLGLTIEDVVTSWFGYNMLPTRKSGEWIAYLVALLPTVGQVAFAYLLLDSGGRKRWAGIVFVALHVADVYTDMVFKATGGDWFVWGIAFLESEILYTLGSELALMTGLAMLVELWPDIRTRLPRVSMPGMVAGLIGEEDDEDESPRGHGGVQRTGSPNSLR